MKTHELPECTDINAKGAYSLDLEVREDGSRRLVCPCCQGSGEHPSHPGNNPDGLDPPCGTCQGEGDLDKIIPISRRKRGRRREPVWNGSTISDWLSIRPSKDLDDWWNIHSKWEGQFGIGNTLDIVKLAHLILHHLEPVNGLDQVQWVKDYRRLNPSATLQQAMQAWDRKDSIPSKTGK